MRIIRDWRSEINYRKVESQVVARDPPGRSQAERQLRIQCCDEGKSE